MVIQFEARLVREAVDASGIGKQVKLEFRVVATALGHRPQDFAGKYEGGLAAEFNHFFDAVWIPRAQVLGHNTSALARILGHRFETLRRRLILMPVERAFFPQIEETPQKYGNVYHHFKKAIQADTRRHSYQVPVNVGP